MIEFPARIWERLTKDKDLVFSDSQDPTNWNTQDWVSREATAEDKERRKKLLEQFGNKWPDIPHE